MKEVALGLILQVSALLFLCYTCGSNCSSYSSISSSSLLDLNDDTLLTPVISPSVDPQPFLPPITPSPLMPFRNNVVPKLSGLCTLNFSAHESLLNITATDCWGLFARYTSNAICCPQLKATLTILIANSSQYSEKLGLNSTTSKHCLSDIDQILQSQGAIENLHEMCSISPFDLTHGSCPVINVNEIDQIVNYSKVVSKCEKLDVASECCTRLCQNEISDAASKIANKGYHNTSSKSKLATIEDCESVVLWWLATKLDPVSMNGLLRGISSCNINKVCPLVLPDTSDLSENCGNIMSNQTACCTVMENYMSLLQEQTLITNLQALNCAQLLGNTLRKTNVTRDVYNICQIKLKDFTLQVTGAPVSSQGWGCLLPSLPSDATYENTYGISFSCDLNENVTAPWPSTSFPYAASCNNNMSNMLPALPRATTSDGTGVTNARTVLFPPVFQILLLLV